MDKKKTLSKYLPDNFKIINIESERDAPVISRPRQRGCIYHKNEQNICSADNAEVIFKYVNKIYLSKEKINI